MDPMGRGFIRRYSEKKHGNPFFCLDISLSTHRVFHTYAKKKYIVHIAIFIGIL